MAHLGEVYLDYMMNGRVQGTRGNRHESAAPHGCYRAKGADSWVIIAVTNDDEWERFCEAIGSPAWTEDPRFATSLDRHSNQDALDELVEQWTVQHDHYEIMHLLQPVRVPVGLVLDHGEVYDDPHIAAPLPYSFHAHQCLMAEPGGALVRSAHRKAVAPGRASEQRRTGGCHLPLPGRYQRRTQALGMDQDR